MAIPENQNLIEQRRIGHDSQRNGHDFSGQNKVRAYRPFTLSRSKACGSLLRQRFQTLLTGLRIFLVFARLQTSSTFSTPS